MRKSTITSFVKELEEDLSLSFIQITDKVLEDVKEIVLVKSSSISITNWILEKIVEKTPDIIINIIMYEEDYPSIKNPQNNLNLIKYPNKGLYDTTILKSILQEFSIEKDIYFVYNNNLGKGYGNIERAMTSIENNIFVFDPNLNIFKLDLKKKILIEELLEKTIQYGAYSIENGGLKK